MNTTITTYELLLLLTGLAISLLAFRAYYGAWPWKYGAPDDLQ